MPAIEIDQSLYETLQKLAKTAGYESAADFARTVLEREAARLGGGEDNNAILQRLKTLGYLS